MSYMSHDSLNRWSRFLSCVTNHDERKLQIQTVEQTIETLVIWNAIALIATSL